MPEQSAGLGKSQNSNTHLGSLVSLNEKTVSIIVLHITTADLVVVEFAEQQEDDGTFESIL